MLNLDKIRFRQNQTCRLIFYFKNNIKIKTEFKTKFRIFKARWKMTQGSVSFARILSLYSGFSLHSLRLRLNSSSGCYRAKRATVSQKIVWWHFPGPRHQYLQSLPTNRHQGKFSEDNFRKQNHESKNYLHSCSWETNDEDFLERLFNTNKIKYFSNL